jgi:hypothetical protein
MPSFDCRQSAARQSLTASQSRRFERSAEPRQKTGDSLKGTLLGELSFRHCTDAHFKGNMVKRRPHAAFSESPASEVLATIDHQRVLPSAIVHRHGLA